MSKLAAPKLGVLAEYMNKYPPLIARSAVPDWFPGIITSRAIELDDVARKGPRESIMVNGKRCYPIFWLLEYLERKGAMRVTSGPDSARRERGRPAA